MRSTGDMCPSASCYGTGYHEYGGMCAKCWVRLTPAQRSIAQGKEPSTKEIIEYRVETRPARNRLLTALLWLWGAAMTAGVLYLQSKR